MLQRRDYTVQGGMKNYTDPKRMVEAPAEWQSAPDQPPTFLSYITDAEADLLRSENVHNKADPSKLGTENVGPAGVPSFDDTGGMSSGTTGESEQDPGGGGWDSDAGDVARAALSFNPQGVETIGGQVYPSGILDRSSTQMDPQVQSSFDPPGLLSWLEPNTPAGWLSYPAMGLKYGTPIGLGLTALDMMWGSNKGKVGTIPGMEFGPSSAMVGGGIGQGRRGTQSLWSPNDSEPHMGRDDDPLPLQVRRLPVSPDVVTEAATYDSSGYGPQVFNPQPYEGYDFTTAGFRGLPSDLFYRPQVAQGGGLMSLRNQAKQVARQGRGGDTMLMHMRPDEVAGLASLGGVTRNPDTGLPENFLGPFLGAMAGGAFAGGAPLMTQALYTGLGAAAGQAGQSYMLGEEDPLKKGLIAGLTAGGLHGLIGYGAEALGGAPHTAKGVPGRAFDTIPEGAKLAAHFPEAASLKGQFPSLVDPARKVTASMLRNPYTTQMMLGGVGGLAAEEATRPAYAGPLPKSGGGGTYRDPRLAPDTRQPTQYAQTVDLTQYGYGPEGRFFYPNIMDPHRLGYTQYAQAGGLQSLPIDDEIEETETVEEVEGGITDLPVEAPMEPTEGGIGDLPVAGGAEALIEDVTQQAIAAIKGDHPEPEIAITRFTEVFGPGAFEGLRRIIIQEERARGLGRAHEGLVRGADGGRDDLRRGNIDGKEPINVSSGEHIWSADDVALAGDGNTEAGARRLDAARNKLRMMAHGTTKRPNYIGEEGVEEVFEEVGVA